MHYPKRHRYWAKFKTGVVKELSPTYLYQMRRGAYKRWLSAHIEATIINTLYY